MSPRFSRSIAFLLMGVDCLRNPRLHGFVHPIGNIGAVAREDIEVGHSFAFLRRINAPRRWNGSRNCAELICPRRDRSCLDLLPKIKKLHEIEVFLSAFVTRIDLVALNHRFCRGPQTEWFTKRSFPSLELFASFDCVPPFLRTVKIIKTVFGDFLAPAERLGIFHRQECEGNNHG